MGPSLLKPIGLHSDISFPSSFHLVAMGPPKKGTFAYRTYLRKQRTREQLDSLKKTLAGLKPYISAHVRRRVAVEKEGRQEAEEKLRIAQKGVKGFMQDANRWKAKYEALLVHTRRQAAAHKTKLTEATDALEDRKGAVRSLRRSLKWAKYRR